MGEADKGLLVVRGRPLASIALGRLAPQVGRLAVNANRNFGEYAAMGVAVWPDSLPDRPGPLGGVLAGLQRCETDYLATVPCDAPRFPLDLVDRLANALVAAGADLAVAAVGTAERHRFEPVFCLVKASLARSLASFLAGGERRVGAWVRSRAHALALFESAEAFANLNTPEDLARTNAPDAQD